MLAQGPAPKCDTWSVATGSVEERPYTRQPDHLGASALVRRAQAALGDSDTSASRSPSMRLVAARASSCAPRSRRARAAVERPILEAAGRAAVNVTWLRDSATGNSDHRELALAGAPATKLGVPDEPVRHTAADAADRLQRGAFARVLRVVLAAAARGRQTSASSRSDNRSASAIVLRFVFARGIVGMTEASATDQPLAARSTRPSPSTTDPIAHVPTGWKNPRAASRTWRLGVDAGPARVSPCRVPAATSSAAASARSASTPSTRTADVALVGPGSRGRSPAVRAGRAM